MASAWMVTVVTLDARARVSLATASIRAFRMARAVISRIIRTHQANVQIRVRRAVARMGTVMALARVGIMPMGRYVRLIVVVGIT